MYGVVSSETHPSGVGFFLRKKWFLLALGIALCFVLTSSLAILLPEASGVDMLEKGGTTIDASHSDQGYIMVKHSSKKALKLRVSLGKQNFTYDLRNDGEYEVFPLQLGEGKYKVQVFEQVSGTKYSTASSLTVNAKIADENLPYLYPSQYVWYTADSAAVAMSQELCGSLATDKEKVEAVYTYILNNFVYDYIRAVQVQQQKGYLPDVDSILEEKKGICFDLSALTCAMLRVQGIPTQMAIGFADKTYHAWNNILVDGTWYQYDLTASIAGMKVKKYTTERIY